MGALQNALLKKITTALEEMKPNLTLVKSTLKLKLIKSMLQIK